MALGGRAILGLGIVLAFSGCFGGGGGIDYLEGPFVLDAPEWKSGNTWTYEGSGRVESSFGDGGRQDETQDTGELAWSSQLRVFNTTERFAGRPAYFVWFDETLEDSGDETVLGSSGPTPFLAFESSSLEFLGTGSCYDGECPSAMDPDNGERPLPPNGPGAFRLDWSGIPFPLEKGTTWTVAGQGELLDLVPLGLTATVKGQTMLEVLGREYLTVHIRIVGRPTQDAERALRYAFLGPDAEGARIDFDARFIGEYYWGVDTSNLVRAVETLTASFTADAASGGQNEHFEGRMKAHFERNLVHYALEETPEEPLYDRPAVPTVPDPPEYLPPTDTTEPPAEPPPQTPPVDPELERAKELEVLAYAPDGLDVAGGPITIEFYLHHPDDLWGLRGAPPQEPALNESRFQVNWQLQRLDGAGRSDALVASGTTSTLSYSFKEAAPFQATVTLYDTVTGATVKDSAVFLDTTWTSPAFRTDQNPGPATRRTLLSIPAAVPGILCAVDVVVSPGLHPTVREPGKFMLVAPDGTEFDLGPDPPQSMVWTAGNRGTWKLDWVPQAASLGDDFEARGWANLPPA